MRDARTLRRVPFAVAVLLSLVVIFTPGPQVPTGVQISDKLIHASLFALLAVTGVLAGLPPVRLAIGLVVYAGASEILQAVLPINRDGDVRDALADSLGAIAGLLVAVVVRRLALRAGRSTAQNR
jgi:VanZ family protein